MFHQKVKISSLFTDELFTAKVVKVRDSGDQENGRINKGSYCKCWRDYRKRKLEIDSERVRKV